MHLDSRNLMKHLIPVLLIVILFLALPLTGCAPGTPLDPSHPVSLTLWHNYGGVMQTAMDQLVESFNDTQGKDLGIIVNVESVNSSSILQEKLLAAANGDPGAVALPDMTTCYPKVAVTLADKGLLADLGAYFTEEELKAYMPSFVEEGRIDGTLYVFPIAKSTEVLFVNQTLFDRFAAQTGVSTESLRTFEGLLSTAKTYHEWSGGKSFYMPDSMFNLMQVGMEQLKDSFIHDEALNTSSATYQYIYDLFREAVDAGHIAVYDGYSSDLQKTGDIIMSTGSTAGILYYGDFVTYADNTTEPVTYSVLPFPVFEGGKKVAIQRGNGMAVIASDEKKEYAAAVFLKWFTQKDHNIEFVSQTGYLPVTKEAYDSAMSDGYDTPENKNIEKLMDTAREMCQTYSFYIPPVFHAYDTLGDEWEQSFFAASSAQ